MFNRKSSYALNKKDPNAIVYMDANDVIIRLTCKEFVSEEEFLKWKEWSDESYHIEDKRDVIDGKRLISIDELSEAALAVPGIDAVMEHQRKRLEDRSRAVAMVAQIREKLTATQFRRLWMYYVDGTLKNGVAFEGVFSRIFLWFWRFLRSLSICRIFFGYSRRIFRIFLPTGKKMSACLFAEADARFYIQFLGQISAH